MKVLGLMEKLVARGQEKIGAYDKQLWEKSVEERVLKSIEQVPKKNARVKAELIDVDLVRGSTFTKAKPQHGWLAVSRMGLLRLLLLPVFLRWWQNQTSPRFTAFLLLLYILQVGTTIAYVTDTANVIAEEGLSLAHLTSPWILTIVLGLMHAQIVATRLSHKHQYRPKEKKRHAKTEKRKRKVRSRYNASTMSERDSAYSAQETGVDTHLEEDSSSSHERRKSSSNISSKLLTSKSRERLKNNVGRMKKTSASPRREFPAPPARARQGAEEDKYARSSAGSDVNTTSGEGCFNNNSNNNGGAATRHRVLVNKSMLNSSLSSSPVTTQSKSAHVNSANRGRKSTVGSVPEITCSNEMMSVSYKSLDGSEEVSACTSDNPSDSITEFAGQLILPDNDNDNDNNANILLTDDLIIKCDCVTSQNQPTDQNSRVHLSKLDKHINSVQRTLKHTIMTHNGGGSGGDGAGTHQHQFATTAATSTTDSSLEYVESDWCWKPDSASPLIHYKSATPKVITSCDEGISVELPLAAQPNMTTNKAPAMVSVGTGEDWSPTTDDMSACSDSLLFDTRKPPQPDVSSTVKTSTTRGGHGAFHPPIIVHTDGEGAATTCNEETDSEVSVPFRCAPEVTVCRRRRAAGTGQQQECDTNMMNKPGSACGKKAGSKKSTDRLTVTSKLHRLKAHSTTGQSSCESEQETNTPNTPISIRGQTSEYEWDDCMHSEVTSSDTSSCSADSDSSDQDTEDPFRATHLQHSSSVMNNLASSSDKVSCMIWEDDQVKKVDLTVLDIGWTIIQKVDKIPQMCDYVVLGVFFALTFTMTPLAFRAYTSRSAWPNDFSDLQQAAKFAFTITGYDWRTQAIILNGAVQRFSLSLIFFFLLSVADRTFKQRLLYAKNFCYLTSSRRAKKYELPHFRLNKVRNIKTWLSLRSYLKKRGPQRSIDTIVSAAFILAVVFVSLMCLKLLQDSGGFMDNLANWELVGWCLALAVYLLRFMTIGTKINRKYRNFSILITEQINLYLHMEQKPHKKEELMLANSVLKLAEDLLKELESPFKISGLSANPFLYNVTKVIVLSAFSAVLTELLGFKLKLYKIKIRP